MTVMATIRSAAWVCERLRSSRVRPLRSFGASFTAPGGRALIRHPTRPGQVPELPVGVSVYHAIPIMDPDPPGGVGMLPQDPLRRIPARCDEGLRVIDDRLLCFRAIVGSLMEIDRTRHPGDPDRRRDPFLPGDCTGDGGSDDRDSARQAVARTVVFAGHTVMENRSRRI